MTQVLRLGKMEATLCEIFCMAEQLYSWRHSIRTGTQNIDARSLGRRGSRGQLKARERERQDAPRVTWSVFPVLPLEHGLPFPCPHPSGACSLSLPLG